MHQQALPLPVNRDQVNGCMDWEEGMERKKGWKSCVQRCGSNGEIAFCPWDRSSSFGTVRNDSWLFSHSPQHVFCPHVFHSLRKHNLSIRRGSMEGNGEEWQIQKQWVGKTGSCLDIERWDQGIRENLKRLIRHDKRNEMASVSKLVAWWSFI